MPASLHPFDPQHRQAYEMMGPGWRDEVLPRQVEAVAPGTARR